MNNRIAEIQQRCEATTPGQWWYSKNSSLFFSESDVLADTEWGGIIISKPDAEFIAHAREDVPYLLSQLECLKRAMYTATTNHYGVDLCCMYCKYGPEGTCEGESTALVGNPIDGQEYDWDCNRCKGVSVNSRGGWEFDYDRWRVPPEKGAEHDRD